MFATWTQQIIYKLNVYNEFTQYNVSAKQGKSGEHIPLC